MPKYKVTSPLMHNGVAYDVEGNAEGKPHEVELTQDLADRCGAVDPTPIVTPAEAEAAAKADQEAQTAADKTAADKAAADKAGKKKPETPKAD
jgi:hypothetical protein